MESKTNQCPEFPYFGARYPDARCIDGYLWDLDKCDDNGGLYGGGEDPCPFCNKESYLKHHVDEENDITTELVKKHIEKLLERYG